MVDVATVRGPVQTSALGQVLVHEHVFVLSEEIRQNYPDLWDEEERVADAVRKLRALAETGVRTIVDPTVIGLGRYIPRIQRINAEVDINIVVATGLYTYNDIPFRFHYQGPGKVFDMPEPMADLFERDITEGIAGTGVRAGLLKCAIEIDGMTPGVERVMRAVAETHRRTGTPITVHTNPHNQSGLLAQQLFEKEDVDLTNVVIGHCGDTTDLNYLTQLADNGSLLGMDRFGLDALLDFEQRVDTVAELASLGYAESMVLSHDAFCFTDWFPAGSRERVAPNWHYTHIHDDVLPALRQRGVTEEQIDTMLVDNPARYLTPAIR
ncbi:MAG: phosphotriesterase family protein [Sciscionella sp.]